MQEWSDLARDSVSRLYLTLPFVSFLVGWLLVAWFITSEDRDSMLLQNVGFYQPIRMVP
jgi:hypothetical protein